MFDLRARLDDVRRRSPEWRRARRRELVEIQRQARVDELLVLRVMDDLARLVRTQQKPTAEDARARREARHLKMWWQRDGRALRTLCRRRITGGAVPTVGGRAGATPWSRRGCRDPVAGCDGREAPRERGDRTGARRGWGARSAGNEVDGAVAEDHPCGPLARRALPLARVRSTHRPPSPPPGATELGWNRRPREPRRRMHRRRYRPPLMSGPTRAVGARRKSQPTRRPPVETSGSAADTRRPHRSMSLQQSVRDARGSRPPRGARPPRRR